MGAAPREQPLSCEPLLHLGQRRAGEDHGIGRQYVAGVEVGAQDGLDAGQVPGGFLEHQVVLRDHEQDAGAGTQLLEELGHHPCLGCVQRDLLDDAHGPVLGLHRKRDAKREPPLLAGHLLFVAARVRTEDHAAVAPLRRPGTALARPPGALLFPGLLAAAGNLAAGLRLVGALAVVGLLPLHRLVQHGLVHRRVEDRLRQFYLAALLPFAVEDCNRHGAGGGHYFFPFGCRAESRTSTTLFLWPGTSPLTSNRLRSRATRTTVRCMVVRCALPSWPAIRIPL